MANYLTQGDLENAISATTVARLYSDDTTGAVNTEAIALNIELAEGLFEGHLIGIHVTPLPQPYDRLARLACLEYLKGLSFDRHPEYERKFGESSRGESAMKRAKELGMQIRAGLLKLPDQPSPATAPRNAGGLILDRGPRLMIDTSDGNENGSGF